MIIYGVAALIIAVLAYKLGFRDGQNLTIDRLVQKGWVNVDATKNQVRSFLKGQAQ
jgi:hypothetical protein